MPKIISRWPSIGKSIGKLSEEAKWNQKILTDIAREADTFESDSALTEAEDKLFATNEFCQYLKMGS